AAPPPVVGLNPQQPQAKLPTVRLFLGAQEMVTEVAIAPVQIGTGMMWRTNMAENESMIFVFSDATPRSFYMRNTLIPLSIAYIAPDGTILEILDMQPRDETSIPSKAGNVQYALETRQGWFARNKVGVGAAVTTQKGTLQQTFFSRP
ncbi:MAG: DUF192 domain-containing protein, partial [Verrucomicrobia bacterium]|nr:DUF192 domain-containing protein [Verrucomicrobiota bacterium]